MIIACNTCCSRGSRLYHGESPVTLEHDLTTVLDLPHVGTILVETHAADQQDLAVLNEPREGTIN